LLFAALPSRRCLREEKSGQADVPARRAATVPASFLVLIEPIPEGVEEISSEGPMCATGPESSDKVGEGQPGEKTSSIRKAPLPDLQTLGLVCFQAAC